MVRSGFKIGLPAAKFGDVDSAAHRDFLAQQALDDLTVIQMNHSNGQRRRNLLRKPMADAVR